MQPTMIDHRCRYPPPHYHLSFTPYLKWRICIFRSVLFGCMLCGSFVQSFTIPFFTIANSYHYHTLPYRPDHSFDNITISLSHPSEQLTIDTKSRMTNLNSDSLYVSEFLFSTTSFPRTPCIPLSALCS